MAELLKDIYNKNFILDLSSNLKKTNAKFDSKFFENSLINKDWEDLAMKERMNKITVFIEKSLPVSYHEQLEVLEKVSPNFSGLRGIIFPDFIEKFGLDYFEESIEALKFHTQFSTSEFAIRHFILKYEKESLEKIYKWSEDSNFHVRRLSSEGTRPILPWGIKLHDFVKNPHKTIPILEKLKDDYEDYVYRSVANHLNDISKYHPELVLEMAEKWMKNSSDSRKWLVKHALRTLLKKGNAKAMSIFGFENKYKISVDEFYTKDKQIKIGDSSQLFLTIKNNDNKDVKLRLEYVISYLKNNQSYSSKVFQIKEFILKKDEVFKTEKKIDFKDLTTRKHYKGEHFISLQINGIQSNKVSFDLL